MYWTQSSVSIDFACLDVRESVYWLMLFQVHISVVKETNFEMTRLAKLIWLHKYRCSALISSPRRFSPYFCLGLQPIAKKRTVDNLP